MNNEIAVRRMEFSDANETKRLMGIFQDFISSMRKGRFSWEEMEKKYWPWILSSVEKKDGFIFLAEKNKTILGFVVGWIELSENFSYPPEMWKRGLVQDLFVCESERGKGLGKLLMDRASTFFLERGLKTMVLHVIPTNPARNFYKRYGVQDGLIRMDLLLEGTG